MENRDIVEIENAIYTDQKANWAYWDELEAILENTIRELAKFSMTNIPDEQLEENIVGLVSDTREVVFNELTRLGGKFPVFEPEIDTDFIEKLREELPTGTPVNILKLPDDFPSYVKSGMIFSIDDDGSVYVATEGGFLRVMPNEVADVIEISDSSIKDISVAGLLKDAEKRSADTVGNELGKNDYVKD